MCTPPSVDHFPTTHDSSCSAILIHTSLGRQAGIPYAPSSSRIVFPYLRPVKAADVQLVQQLHEFEHEGLDGRRRGDLDRSTVPRLHHLSPQRGWSAKYGACLTIAINRNSRWCIFAIVVNCVHRWKVQKETGKKKRRLPVGQRRPPAIWLHPDQKGPQ